MRSKVNFPHLGILFGLLLFLRDPLVFVWDEKKSFNLFRGKKRSEFALISKTGYFQLIPLERVLQEVEFSS